MRTLAANIAVESTIDPGSIQCAPDLAALLVATPDLTKRRKLRTFDRRIRTRGAKDHPNRVAAGAIDGVPQRADFVWRHPVLGIEQHHRINLAGRHAFQE